MLLLELALVAVTVGLLLTPFPILALGPGVAGVAGLWIARNPAFALYAVVAMIPFGAIRKIGGADLPWILAAVLVGLLFIQAALQRTLPGVRPSLLWILLFAYFGVNAVSAVLSARPEQLQQIYLLLFSYVFILLVIVYLAEEGFRQTLHRVIVWSVSVGSILSILSYLLGGSAFSELHPDGSAQERFMGGAIDPNNQAIMILFALPLSVHLAVYSEKRSERLIMAGLSFICVLAVALTRSRSGFLAGLLVVGLLVIQHWRWLFEPRRIGILIAAGALGSVVLLAAIPSSFFERQASLAEWEDNSLLRRTSYLVVAWEAIQDRPVIGSGPGSFRDIYSESEIARTFSSLPERRTRRAHNTYLEVLVGSGVLGLGLFVAVLVYTWKGFRHAERVFRARGDYVLSDLLRSYCIAYGVLVIFLMTFSETHHKFLLLSIGLSQVAVRVAELSVAPSDGD